MRGHTMSSLSIAFAIFAVLSLAALVDRYIYTALFWGSLALGVAFSGGLAAWLQKKRTVSS